MTKHDFSDRLGMDADVVFSYLVTPTEREMRKAKTQISDMKQALVEKRAREQKHLDRVEEVGVMLDRLHRKMEEDGPDLLMFCLVVLLEDEQRYHEDQASRAHVDRQLRDVKTAQQRYRILRMKRMLTHAVAG